MPDPFEKYSKKDKDYFKFNKELFKNKTEEPIIKFDHENWEDILKRVEKKGQGRGAGDPRIEAVRQSVLIESKPDTKFSDIVGQEEAVRQSQELCEQVAHPEVFEAYGVEAPKGILFYGPPGTGKTTLARAIASESDSVFMVVKSSDVMNMWVGESEKTVQALFGLASLEHEESGRRVLIYLDEVESLLPKEGDRTPDYIRRIRSEFLQQMEGFSSNPNITIIASTNNPDLITPAFLSRMQRWVEVGLPSPDGRIDLFNYYLSKKLRTVSEKRGINLDTQVDFGHVAEITEGMSGRDIRDIVNLLFAGLAFAEISGQQVENITTEGLEQVINANKKVINDRTETAKRPMGFNNRKY